MSAPPPERVHRRAHFSRLLTGGGAEVDAPERRRRRALRGARRAALAHPRVAWLRWIAGWFVIALGILGVLLPGLPALVLIPLGVALVGRRSTFVRWWRTRMKLLLRVAETWRGVPGRVGRILRERERRIASYLRARRIGAWERPRRG